MTVQRALGHPATSITLDTCSHLWPDANNGTRKAAAGIVDQALAPTADGGPASRRYSGRSGLTANWITRYGAAPRARVSHWLTKIRSSSSVEPGEM